jgi:fused signal recognition particle receptor
MNELSNVLALVTREQPGAPHETLLVIDATTGQNALQQAREFHEKVTLTGVVVTKLDGTSKGGILVAIKDELGIPIRYIGIGESVDALKKFDPREFAEALFAEADGSASAGVSGAVSPAPARRRREFERTDSFPLSR